jgi:hypothetical protein
LWILHTRTIPKRGGYVLHLALSVVGLKESEVAPTAEQLEMFKNSLIQLGGGNIALLYNHDPNEYVKLVNIPLVSPSRTCRVDWSTISDSVQSKEQQHRHLTTKLSPFKQSPCTPRYSVPRPCKKDTGPLACYEHMDSARLSDNNSCCRPSTSTW